MTKCAWVDIDTGKGCDNKALPKGEPSYCEYHQLLFLKDTRRHDEKC